MAPPDSPTNIADLLVAPLPPDEAVEVALQKGPNINPLPDLAAIPNRLEVPILLKVGDDISTDEIMPAGSRVLPFRSNIPKISEFCFDVIDDSYSRRALDQKKKGGHAIVGGANYGQGSSREHAALAPRYLGLTLVIAHSLARIHRQNLIGFGILPLTFANPVDYDEIQQGDVVVLDGIREQLRSDGELELDIKDKDTIVCRHDLSPRQVDILLAGGLINQLRSS